MSLEKKRCLIITGTVIPHSNYVTHTNPDIRLEEYFKALLFYSKQFQEETIYFLENSEYDFSSNKKFQQLFNERKIILLKFPVSEKINEGKGYQEFEMLDKAIESLKNDYYSFIKLTGRYIVKNIAQLTNYTCEGIVIESHRKPAIAHTNLFYSTVEFYNDHLKGLYKFVNDSQHVFIEKLVYKKIHGNRQVKLFSNNPQIEGISGSYGISLKRNPIKMNIRTIERKLLRSLGIQEFLIEY